MAASSTKPLNGTIVPQVSAADVVGDAILPFISPGHYRATPPILDLRGSSIGPESIQVVAPVPTIAFPCMNFGGALSIDTGTHGTYCEVVAILRRSGPYRKLWEAI